MLPPIQVADSERLAARPITRATARRLSILTWPERSAPRKEPTRRSAVHAHFEVAVGDQFTAVSCRLAVMAARRQSFGSRGLSGGSSDVGGGDVGRVPVQAAAGPVIPHRGP